MKLFLTLLIFLEWICVKGQSPLHSTTKYNENGSVKEVTSLNINNLKEGETLYYNQTGSLDSSTSFKNGKLNGITKVYYSEDDIFYFNYENNSLISHRIYDSTHKLKYESPLPLKLIPKTTFQFISGRNYYDHTKLDTLTINRDVPFMNQTVYFPGATVMSLDKYSWIIKAWEPQPNSQKGKMVIVMSQFGVEDSHVSQLYKVIREEIVLIPIK